ncbi:MAG: VWA domain-containing protein, partial [Planctomycetota bacterium]
AGAAVFGGAQRTERVILIDDSLSLAYRTPTGQVMDRAKEAVRRIVENIREETPDDTVTLLRMTAPDQPLEAGTFLDAAQTQRLLERVDALSPTFARADPGRAVSAAADLLRRNPDTINAAVYIISDFRQPDWTAREVSVSGTQAGGSIMAPLEEWAQQDHGLHILLVDVGEEDAPNTALTDLRLSGGQMVAGAEGTLRIGVAHFSRTPVENLELHVTVGNRPQPSKTLHELGAFQHATVDVPAEFLRAGYESVRAELPEDRLPEDNARYAATEVVSAVRVLIVNGEPAPDSFEDEVTFLATALRPEGEVFSGVEVTVVDEAEMENASLSGFHVVILANVYRVPDPMVDALERFVSRGGGLIVFLGDQVDADSYNGALYREGRGLLPAALTDPLRPASPAHLTVVDRLHPAMRGLSLEGDPLGIGQIAFFRFFGCEPFTPATEENDQPRPAATNLAPARVLARFDDEKESPAIVERPFGGGRVILITTTADKEWNDWPDHPTFLPIVMELVRSVTRQAETARGVIVGEPIELPLSPAQFEQDAVVRTPAYPDEREVAIAAAPGGGGKELVFRWEHTRRPGIYQFLLTRREGGEAVVLAAVNVDPRESDLTPAGEDALRKTMGDLPFEYIRGVDNLGRAGEEARVEFWRLFLAAAVVVLMTEQFLAWRWGRRR